MKTYVINLERRPDRKNHIKELFQKNGITEYQYFKAVDGKKLTGSQELFQLFFGNDFGWKKATIGCALSHYNLWEMAASDNFPYCIFEDDIELTDNIEINLKKCQNFMQSETGPDILFLGYHMFSNKRAQVKDIYDGPVTNILFHRYNS